MSGGDCFEAALSTAVELSGQPSLFVVHGLPVGRGKENAGLRYWHAWVETQVPEARKLTWAVADWSNGQRRIFIARTTYYRLGRLPQHLVWRYTLRQAAEQVDAHGHGGPWHPRADELEELPDRTSVPRPDGVL